MGKGRLEAFSDGVLAIIITIMVLEFRLPAGSSLHALLPLWPALMSYVLSFTNIGIYWNNHHHMLHSVEKINGNVLWANTHLLFWLSLIPFATNWMGENRFALWPVVLYGAILCMAGIAYYMLAHCLMELHGTNSAFSKALGNDNKGKISVLIYAVGIGLCFINPFIGFALYAFVAVIWFIPDRRFEKRV